MAESVSGYLDHILEFEELEFPFLFAPYKFSVFVCLFLRLFLPDFFLCLFVFFFCKYNFRSQLD